MQGSNYSRFSRSFSTFVKKRTRQWQTSTRIFVLIALVFSLGNIVVPIVDATDIPSYCIDNDQDGYYQLGDGCGPVDCNDDNPDSWRIDSYWYDGDKDGYHLNAPNSGADGKISICYGTDIPVGYTENTLGEDCDDTDPQLNVNCDLPTTGNISGCKWQDLNGNGGIDDGDEKLSDWTINLFSCSPLVILMPGDLGDLFLASVAPLDCVLTSSTTTDADGCYEFKDLTAGTYRVAEVQQDNWQLVYPTSPDYHEVNISGGENISNFDFYNMPLPYCGDGIVNTKGEQCDDGPAGSDTCTTECRMIYDMCLGHKVYTENIDFDEGTLINITKNPANQLQLDDTVEPFGFIWVANSGKGTIVKINTDTGEIMGEYRTSPDNTYGNPSRTTVDKDGSVWVGNRNAVTSDSRAAITHVGLVENVQCEDRNGNGVIDTSTGLNDVLPWVDASGDRGVATAADECIVHFTPLAGSDARHISVDAQNNVWAAGYYNRTFEYVKGGNWSVPGSGSIIRTEGPAEGYYGGYGGLIDKNGVIWSASNLLRWDTANPLTGPNGGNWTGYDHSSYGLCIDSQGNVFNTEYGSNVYKHAPDGTLLATFSHGTGAAQGCVVDKNDDLWVAGSLSGSTVDHLKNDGTFIGSVPVGSGPTGVAVDQNGKIWVTNHYSQTVMRIDPTAGPIGADGVTPVGAVDFTTPDLGGYLYNYSDMTGSTLSGMADNGNWTVVRDSGFEGFTWEDIVWQADISGDGQMTVSLQVSDNGLDWSTPQTVTNGQNLNSFVGRYIKISVSFTRSSQGQSPVLYDLTLNSPCGVPEQIIQGGGGGPISTTQSTPPQEPTPQEPVETPLEEPTPEPEPEVQVLGFETEAPVEEPEVQVLGYEELPETGGSAASRDFTLYGLFVVIAGGYLVSRYRTLESRI